MSATSFHHICGVLNTLLLCNWFSSRLYGASIPVLFSRSELSIRFIPFLRSIPNFACMASKLTE